MQVLSTLATTVRDALPADAAEIAAIGKEAVPQTYATLCDPAVIHNIIEQSYALDEVRDCISRCLHDPSAHFLVAELDGRVVGFLHYDAQGEAPELHRIYVAPREKRRGIGSALMEELHRRLPPGASYILMVVADNEPAVDFYRRHRLVELERVDGVTYMHEHMGVDFPAETPPVPALVLSFTNSP